MISEGQIVLFRFPKTDQGTGKLRPALAVRKLPGLYDDWLICMVSSQVFQRIVDFDELIMEEASDFSSSGLKVASVVRISRLAVVESSVLRGAIGSISEKRLARVRRKLADWIAG